MLHSKAMRWCLFASFENGVLFSALVFLVTALKSLLISLPHQMTCFSFSRFLIQWVYQLGRFKWTSPRENHFSKTLESFYSMGGLSTHHWEPIGHTNLLALLSWLSSPPEAPILALHPQSIKAPPRPTHIPNHNLGPLGLLLWAPVQPNPALWISSNMIPKGVICWFNFKHFALQQYSRP